MEPYLGYNFDETEPSLGYDFNDIDETVTSFKHNNASILTILS